MSGGMGGNLKAIRDDRKSRLMLAGAGLVIFGALVYAFMPSSEGMGSAALPNAPATDAAPGGTVVSPRYAEALRTADQQRVEAAQNVPIGRGAAALPTPVFQGLGDRLPSVFGPREETGRDPPAAMSVEPVRPQPEPPAQALVAPAQAPAQPPPVVVDPSAVQAMQEQMRRMLSAQVRPAETQFWLRGDQQQLAHGSVSGPAPAMTARSSAPTAAVSPALHGGPAGGAQLASASPAGGTQAPQRLASPAPGTILYARLVGRVNSDVPGPVIGEVLQGPLSGARLLGQFQFSERGVIINFTSMTLGVRDADGSERTETARIRAVAVDSANLGAAMATSIDRRILERVALGFATAFMQGLGTAIAASGASTTVLPGGSVSVTTPTLNTTQQLLIAGGGAAGNTARIIEQTYGRRRTTIVVEADTPFGLLFLDQQSGN